MNGPVVIGLLILFTLAVIYADKWLDILMKPGTPMQWDETDTFPRMEQALTDHPATREWMERNAPKPRSAQLKQFKRWTE